MCIRDRVKIVARRNAALYLSHNGVQRAVNRLDFRQGGADGRLIARFLNLGVQLGHARCVFIAEGDQHALDAAVALRVPEDVYKRQVCGRLKSDYRYSKDIVYNNFLKMK